jgi:hypothetical protein
LVRGRAMLRLRLADMVAQNGHSTNNRPPHSVRVNVQGRSCKEAI